MPKKHRLSGAQIRRLKPDKRLISSLFSLSVTKSEVEAAQTACVVSKKVSPKAVVRNTIQRRMRASLAGMPLPHHVSLILTAKKPVVDSSFAEVRADIGALISKLRGGK